MTQKHPLKIIDDILGTRSVLLPEETKKIQINEAVIRSRESMAVTKKATIAIPEDTIEKFTKMAIFGLSPISDFEQLVKLSLVFVVKI